MTDFTIRPYDDRDLPAVRKLWEACNLTVPYNDPVKDIAFCRASTDADVFVGEEAERLMATIMTGHDGHRGWMYYVAVDPNSQGKGFGRRMVHHAESWLSARGVSKVNLMIRESNEAAAGFYAALGYTSEPLIVMARFLNPDAG